MTTETMNRHHYNPAVINCTQHNMGDCPFHPGGPCQYRPDTQDPDDAARGIIEFCGRDADHERHPQRPPVEAGVFAEGVAEGRRQAAEDIRVAAEKYIGAQYRHMQMCARIAERLR